MGSIDKKTSNLRRTGVLTVKDSPAHEDPVQTVVLEASRTEMKLSLAEPLLPGTKVELRLDSGDHIVGTVRYCRQVDECEYQAGVQRAGVDEILERRKEHRYPVSGKVRVRYFDPHSLAVEQNAVLADVSKGGMGLNIREPIPEGTMVELMSDGTTVTGLVRNCRPHQGGFRIGIALTAVEARPKGRTVGDSARESLERSRTWFSKAVKSWNPRLN